MYMLCMEAWLKFLWCIPLTKSKIGFLNSQMDFAVELYLETDQSKITRIMVHQRNQRILAQSGKETQNQI